MAEKGNGLVWPDWFNKPQGSDYPKKLYSDCIKWRHCHILLGDVYVKGKACLVLDSQQSRLAVTVYNKEHGQVVFTAENCDIDMAFEGEGNASDVFIHQHRNKAPGWFQPWHKVYYYKIRSFESPIIAGQTWQLPETDSETWKLLTQCDWINTEVVIWMGYEEKMTAVRQGIEWMRELVALVHMNIQHGQPRGLWYYYAMNSDESDESDKSNPQAKGLPWLWKSDSEYLEYTHWFLRDHFFLNDHERRWRLLQATRNERQEQEQAVVRIFNTKRIHQVTFVQSQDNQSDWYLHVKVLSGGGSKDTVPELAELTPVEFSIFENSPDTTHEISLENKGSVVDTDTNVDFVVLSRRYGFSRELNGKRRYMIASIKPNLMPIDAQIKALDDASSAIVHGDGLDGAKEGFSLRRTVLAHGTELDPKNSNYFLLDARQMSTVPREQQEERLAYIAKIFTLDETQHAAFEKSVLSVCGGVHLIQGPPGTGKTRTATAIILTLAALNLKVLLAAGSNKGVDNLAKEVIKALEHHPKLRSWCGQLVRFRTPSYQLSVVRRHSATNMHIRRAKGDMSGADFELQEYQIHNLVQKFAKEHRHGDAQCQKFLDLAEVDRTRGLSNDSAKVFRAAYEHVVGQVLATSKVVATTLSAASHDVLQLSGFNPEFLVSDDSGQCLEGDHMIAMTMPSIRSVTLLGDPEQLPPTVISEHGTNEGALFLKRSLMTRLQNAGYPCTMLDMNYRSHAEILEWYNKAVYGGALKAAPQNGKLERVGNAWDDFTRSRHMFRNTGVAGVRRLFLSTMGTATQQEGSLSWCNMAQTEVVEHLLLQLYAFRAANGDQISPADIMILSPYKDQKKMIGEHLKESRIGYRDNLTIDAAQGLEAPVVILSLTKPSKASSLSPGFLADKQRLNVALSRAQKVLIIIGNLAVWNHDAIRKMRSMSRKNQVLADLLVDVTAKSHTINWVDQRTVEEIDPPGGIAYGHSVLGRRMLPPSLPADPLRGTREPRPSVTPSAGPMDTDDHQPQAYRLGEGRRPQRPSRSPPRPRRSPSPFAQTRSVYNRSPSPTRYRSYRQRSPSRDRSRRRDRSRHRDRSRGRDRSHRRDRESRYRDDDDDIEMLEREVEENQRQLLDAQRRLREFEASIISRRLNEARRRQEDRRHDRSGRR